MGNKSACILNYGSGNINSGFNILIFLGFNVKISEILTWTTKRKHSKNLEYVNSTIFVNISEGKT